MVQRAYRFRLYPTPEQAEQLARTFGCARFVYNHFLRVRADSFFKGKRRIGYNDTTKLLTTLKQQPETVWLNEVSNVCLQQSLRNLDAAFRDFFQQRAKYPAFKSKHGPQSVRYMNNAFRIKDGELWLAKQDAPLNVRWSRKLPSAPSSITVSRDCAGRYFVSLLCEEDIKPLPVTTNVVGVDLALNNALITSEGRRIANPQFLLSISKRLTAAQRRLSRKQEGSKNRAKARVKVARLHARVSDARNDWSNKLTTQLVRENQVISAESLAVKNVFRNRRLARAIANVGWSEIVRKLEYKSAWHGRTFVKIDRLYPSGNRCSCCGHILSSPDLVARFWNCPECGATHDRDINAAVNIRDAGLAIIAGADMLRMHEKDTGGPPGI